MNTYDKSSLVLIPSGIKDGKIYSQRPENGDGDFTFSRGSNLAATRVNEAGLIEKGRENLLLQSNQFDTTWGNSNTTETGGQADKDGGTDAWLLTKSASNGYLIQSLTPAGVQTASIYAKAGDSDWVYLQAVGTSTASCYFDLINGTTGSTGSLIDKSIELIGNGWYRCSITYNQTLSNFRIYPAEANSLSASSGSIYIQDAQLEYGLVATDYIETTTTAVYGGITDNIPRLDYTDASCPSLKLEPQRTNAVPYSEYFNTGWSKVGSSVTSNAATSPEGLQNATKLVEDTSTGLHMLSYTNLYVVGAGDDNYLTLYAKEGERRYLAISSRGNFSNNDNTLIFDTRDGVWANNNSGQNTGQDPVDVGNGWWRIQILNDSSSAAYDGFGIGIAEAGDNWDDASYTGDGTSGIYIWGAQAETGSYATSYIPTYGSAVTRNGDYGNGAGNTSTFNDSEGVLYLESSWLSNELGTSTIAISDGSTSNRIILGYIGADDDLYATSIGGASAPSLMRYNVGDITTNHKIAIKYKANDFALWIDGVERGTQSSGTTPVGLSTLSFSSGSGGSIIYGNMKQIIYFPTALSDSELAALTTI